MTESFNSIYCYQFISRTNAGVSQAVFQGTLAQVSANSLFVCFKVSRNKFEECQIEKGLYSKCLDCYYDYTSYSETITR